MYFFNIRLWGVPWLRARAPEREGERQREYARTREIEREGARARTHTQEREKEGAVDKRREYIRLCALG